MICYNGGRRRDGHNCECPPNYAPPNCYYCYEPQLTVGCVIGPQRANDSQIMPDSRILDSSNDPVKVAGSLWSFLYAFGFIVGLIILATILSIHQVGEM